MSLEILLAELDYLRRDAARYRFLRKGELMDHGIYDDWLLRSNDDLDRCVDAAIARTTPGKGASHE